MKAETAEKFFELYAQWLQLGIKITDIAPEIGEVEAHWYYGTSKWRTYAEMARIVEQLTED